MSFVIVRGKSGVLCWRGDHSFAKGTEGAKVYASEAAAKRALPKAAEMTNQRLELMRVAPLAEASQAQFITRKKTGPRKAGRKAA